MLDVFGKQVIAPRPLYLLLIILIMTLGGSCYGQRFFSLNVNGNTRGYLLSESGKVGLHGTLVIVLHEDQQTALRALQDANVWSTLPPSTIVTFPTGLNGSASCVDSLVRRENSMFIKAIINHVFNNFKINRNNVYLFAVGENACIGEQFVNAFPGVIHTLKAVSNGSTANLVESINDVIQNTAPAAEEKYALWEQPVQEKDDKPRLDSIKRATWTRRMTLKLFAGNFAMLPAVRTTRNDRTYMDISDVNRVVTFELTKWMNDSMAWFIDFTWLRIPRKQDVSFQSDGVNVQIQGEGGGGLVFPTTVGFKYALHRYMLRPYFQLGVGPTSVTVIGGRFRSNSGNINPAAIQNQLNTQNRIVMHLLLGTGFDWRLSNRFVLAGTFRYFHSGIFESAGQVNAIKGFSLSLGAGFVLGANKTN